MSLLDSVPSLFRSIVQPSQRPAPRLSPLGLRDVTCDYAARSDIWAPLLQYGTGEHWSMRIHADADVDVWLITWLQEQSTTLHDHGGSAGAFTVVRGRLHEYLPGATEFEVGAGSTRTFGPRHIHDVYNPHTEAAVSVHAYSPPLTSMSYYRPTRDGGVRLVGTERTSVPESGSLVLPSTPVEAGTPQGA